MSEMRALEKERAIVMKPKRKEHRQIELHELNERKRFAAKRTEEKRKKNTSSSHLTNCIM